MMIRLPAGSYDAWTSVRAGCPQGTTGSDGRANRLGDRAAQDRVLVARQVDAV